METQPAQELALDSVIIEDGARVFLTGATGYIGGRLAPRLLEEGYRLRCLARSERKLRGREWVSRDSVEVVEGDVGDEEGLAKAMEGCQAAYYLVHSMESAGAGYREKDLELAESFGRAAASAGVSRIIYLGGLGNDEDELSEHLSSRREVEKALGAGGVPVTVFRAAMIIGSGSASFEILRYLVERLPIMVTPKWVRTECQPVAIADVLFYLSQALKVPETTGKTLEIGGPDVMTYQEIMEVTAEQLELPPTWVVPIPVLTPKLSSWWIHLVTPLSKDIARPLAEGLKNRVVVRDVEVQWLMPRRCLSVLEAVDEALRPTLANTVETSWSDAGPMPGDPDWAGGTVFTDNRSAQSTASREALWMAVCALGGRHGYYGQDWLWRLRGSIDRVVGGPGLRRGRRDPRDLRVGDALDFWRVVEFEPYRMVLAAEMRVPGIATLTLEVDRGDEGCSELTLTARFKPRGLIGMLYWWMVYPFHGLVFQGMMRGIIDAAEDPGGVKSLPVGSELVDE